MIDDIKPARPRPATGTMKSTLLPIASSSITFDKGYILVAIVTAISVALLFIAIGAGERLMFVATLACYVTFIQCAVIYSLCGRRELWPSMIGVFAVACFLFLFTNVFADVASLFSGPRTLALKRDPNLALRFVGQFIAVGATEELFKALPLLGLAVLGLLCKSGSAPAHLRAISLTEPLDGIALGAASGAAFALLETVFVYYPRELVTSGLTSGLELVIARLISQLGGHIAFSGYFGYFIGLAVLRPKAAPLYLVVGFVTAAAMHGAWNAMAQYVVAMLILGALGIAFLVAAILKARRLSPTRNQNFATRTFAVAVPAAVAQTSAAAAPAREAAVVVAPAMEASASPAETRHEKAPVRLTRGLVLAIGPVVCEAKAGLKIEPQMLGSAGARRGKGPIADVVADATRLGLRNLGEVTWRIRSARGSEAQVGPGQVVPLVAGTVIDFGGIEGVVKAN